MQEKGWAFKSVAAAKSNLNILSNRPSRVMLMHEECEKNSITGDNIMVDSKHEILDKSSKSKRSSCWN